MVLNTRRALERMEEKGLSRAAMSAKTGLTLKSLEWIFENGEISADALERIADVLETGSNEIAASDPTMEGENVIEFMKDGSRATVTFCQGRYISKIRKLAARCPDDCQIIAENDNRSIVASIPVRWIRINATREISEKQIANIARMNALNAENRRAAVNKND
ncbi:MAG: helix-turn-helix transcriptional regulator [Lachnospiraceae bacterium]|nr:helix-turn-helix transcriptional regulator [Lachnospiraceae bacterium]